MPPIEMPPERLTYFERAVCYYTLPRITHPVTIGLIVVYTVCLLEAIWIITYGYFWNNDLGFHCGCCALAGLIILGITAFMLRGLLNEIRMRRTLAIARRVPDASEPVADVPDPFADHILLRHPLHTPGDSYPCTDNDGTVLYFVESRSGYWWHVGDSQDTEVLRVHVESWARSFVLGEHIPTQLKVHAGEQVVATMRAQFSLTVPILTLESQGDEKKTYVIRRDGIYRNKKLVGRTYYLHHSVYLDVEKTECCDGLLGFFVTLT